MKERNIENSLFTLMTALNLQGLSKQGGMRVCVCVCSVGKDSLVSQFHFEKRHLSIRVMVLDIVRHCVSMGVSQLDDMWLLTADSRFGRRPASSVSKILMVLLCAP